MGMERDPAGVDLEGGAASAGPCAARRGAAEPVVKDVLDTAAAAAAKAAGAGAAGAEWVGLKTAPPARVAAGKTLKARLALGVDFAAVELLALVLVADDLVGRIDLGEPRSSFRIVLVVVGVMLLGKLAIGALDRRRAGAPRHPQDLIGVAHPSSLLYGKSGVKFRAARPIRFDLGSSWHFCNGMASPQPRLHGFKV